MKDRETTDLKDIIGCGFTRRGWIVSDGDGPSNGRLTWQIEGEANREIISLTIRPTGDKDLNWYGSGTMSGKYARRLAAAMTDAAMIMAEPNGVALRWLMQFAVSHFVVEQATTGGWENTWHDEDEPQTFGTEQEAEQEISDLIECMDAAHKRGDISEPYKRSEYRIVEVKN